MENLKIKKKREKKNARWGFEPQILEQFVGIFEQEMFYTDKFQKV